MMNQTASRKSIQRKSNARKQAPQEDSPRLFALHAAKSALFSVLFGLLLLLLLSLALSYTPNPSPFIGPIGWISSGLTALVGGIIAVRIHGKSALLCGAVNGCVLMALMLIASLFFKENASSLSVGMCIALHAAFLALSIAGGYVGMPKPSKRKKKH